MQVRLREQKNRSSDVYGLDWGTLIWEGDLRTFVGDHYDAFETDDRFAEIARDIMMRGEYIGGGGEQPYFQLMNAPTRTRMPSQEMIATP